MLCPPESRRRGLTNSSMPKFSSESAVPSSAMARPAGTNHHHAFLVERLLAAAQ